jgi:hypothetical protein
MGRAWTGRAQGIGGKPTENLTVRPGRGCFLVDMISTWDNIKILNKKGERKENRFKPSILDL